MAEKIVYECRDRSGTALQGSGGGKIEKENKYCFRMKIRFRALFPSFAGMEGLSGNAFPKKRVIKIRQKSL